MLIWFACCVVICLLGLFWLFTESVCVGLRFLFIVLNWFVFIWLGFGLWAFCLGFWVGWRLFWVLRWLLWVVCFRLLSGLDFRCVFDCLLFAVWFLLFCFALFGICVCLRLGVLF